MELYDNFYLNTSCKQNLLLFKERSIIILTMIKEIERKTKYKYLYCYLLDVDCHYSSGSPMSLCDEIVLTLFAGRRTSIIKMLEKCLKF